MFWSLRFLPSLALRNLEQSLCVLRASAANVAQQIGRCMFEFLAIFTGTMFTNEHRSKWRKSWGYWCFLGPLGPAIFVETRAPPWRWQFSRCENSDAQRSAGASASSFNHDICTAHWTLSVECWALNVLVPSVPSVPCPSKFETAFSVSSVLCGQICVHLWLKDGRQKFSTKCPNAGI